MNFQVNTSQVNIYIYFTHATFHFTVPFVTRCPTGERVWPLVEDFDEDLKSDVADVLQCRQPTEGDHLYATSFLKRYST